MRLFLRATVPTAVLAWLAIGLYLQQSYRSATAVAEQGTRNLAHAFEENVRRSVESIDNTLGAVRAARALSPDRFGLAAWERASGLTRDLTLQISIADRDGLLTDSNLGALAPGATIADRPHFIGTKQDPQDRLFISVPVIGRVSGRWSVQFARKLYNQQHELDGVVVASLDPTFLSRFYQSLDIGQGALLLAGQDGVLRAVAPDTLAPLGSDLGGLSLSRMLQAPSGTIATRVSAAGQGFLFSWRTVAPYGLVVAVGESRKDVLRPFRHDVRLWAVIGSALTMLICGFGLTVARGRRQVDRSQAVLRAAVENIDQGLLVVDGSRAVRVINTRALELLELPDRFGQDSVRFDELLAYQERNGEFTGPEQEHVRRLVRSGGLTPGTSVYQRRRANGTVLEFHTKVLESGLAVRTITDITDVQNTAEVLARARDDAEQAARRRSEFLTVMSHEIRTPLNGVIGVASLLAGLELEPLQREYVRLIHDSSDHLLHLINDVLDFSRLEAARVELERLPFSPAKLLEDVEILFKPQALAKGLRLQRDAAVDVPDAVLGDPGRLRQVLLNLVGNAVKFTDAGHVRISLETRPCDDARIALHFSVADSGIGIVPEAIPTIFQDFVQMDSSISRRFGGSGLGLAICRRLVALMGGQIGVESKVGAGTTFTFMICCDLAGARSTPPVLPAAADDLPCRGLRVVVAEDNATNQVVVRHLLERGGHEVTVVGTGAAALQALSGGEHDLVLMDVMMPLMDGLTATRRIRAAATSWAGIPILGLTAGSRPEDLAACRAAGMDEVATKPITADRLAAALRRVAEAAEMRGRSFRLPPPAAAVGRSAPKAGLLDGLIAELGEDAVQEVVAAFRHDARLRLAEMLTAAARPGRAGLRDALHGMKGAARGVGAEALARLAAEGEEAIESWSDGEVRDSVRRIGAELELVETALDAASGPRA